MEVVFPASKESRCFHIKSLFLFHVDSSYHHSVLSLWFYSIVYGFYSVRIVFYGLNDLLDPLSIHDCLVSHHNVSTFHAKWQHLRAKFFEISTFSERYPGVSGCIVRVPQGVVRGKAVVGKNDS